MSELFKNDGNVLNSEELENVSGGMQIDSEIMLKTGEQIVELYKIASQLNGMTREQIEDYLKSIGKL